MNITNNGVQAGGSVNFQNSNVSFGGGSQKPTPQDECLLSLAFRTMDVREDLPERTPGTGEWILHHQHYSSWLQLGDILWILGRPGCGKSMLMDFLIEVERQRHADSQTTVLSFFHPSPGPLGAPESAVDLFRSLCFQLIKAHENLLPHFMAHTNFTKKSKTGLRHPWKAHELREWLFLAVSKLLLDGQSVLVFIDAMDELNAGAAVSTAEQLRKWVLDQRANLRVCVSCHLHLSDGTQMRWGDFIIDLQVENKGDMVSFLEAQLAHVRQPADSEQLKSVKSELLKGTKGVFQWLKWSVQKAKTLIDAEEPMSYVLRQIQKYPKQLDAIYEQMLPVSDDEVEEALPLLQCLALAGGLIRAEDLRHAVCLDDRTSYKSVDELLNSPYYCETDELLFRRVRRLSRGLVRSCDVDVAQFDTWRTTGVLRARSAESTVTLLLHFDHGSVGRFMLAKGLAILEERLERPKLSKLQREAQMTKQLLAYLQAAEVRSFAQHFPDIDAILKALCEGTVSAIHPDPGPMLTEYASTRWYEHAQAAECDLATASNLSDHLAGLEKSIWPHLSTLLDVSRFGWSWCYSAESTLCHVLSRCGLSLVLASTLDHVRAETSAESFRSGYIDVRDRGGRTPLFTAAENNQMTTTRVLLDAKADANIRNTNGWTPLYCAAGHGNVELARVLLAQPGVDADAVDLGDHTPLHLAVMLSGVPMAKELMPYAKRGIHSPRSPNISKGLNVSQEIPPALQDRDTYVVLPKDWPTDTPLAVAFKHGRVEVLQFLLDHFREGNVAQEQGRNSLLHYISIQRDECFDPSDIVADLFDTKADLFDTKADLIINSSIFDVNWRGEHGRTPLCTAAEHAVAPVVRLLLGREDVDVNAVDDDGATALMRCIRPSCLEQDEPNECVAYLLCHGSIQPDKPDFGGSTPFLEAVKHRNVYAATRLAQTGKVNFNARDSTRTPAFHLAVDSGEKLLVNLFMKEEGVDHHATDDLDEIPLMRAVRRGNFAIVMGLASSSKQWDVIESLEAVSLAVALARNEHHRDPDQKQREAIFLFIDGYSQGPEGESRTNWATLTAIKPAKRDLGITEILASLRSARYRS